jgi:hypothetical protein
MTAWTHPLFPAGSTMHKPLFLIAAALLLAAAPTFAADAKKERDIFDYEGQRAAKDVKKIVFVADTGSHGARGNHEFLADAIYFARTINADYPKAWCVVHTKDKWPKDLKHADAVIVLLNHGGSAVNVEVNKGDQGDNYLKWMGGYFEPFWSVNPTWTPDFKELPRHEVTRGVKPFKIDDEWYYHMRFVGDMKGVTPILSATAPVKTITDRYKEGDKPKSHEGNPDVLADVKAGKKQVMAWAYERPDGGRGFGFTGLHKHANLANDNFRTLLLNAVAWVSKLEVPEKGVSSKTLTHDDLEKLIDDGKLAIKNRGI